MSSLHIPRYTCRQILSAATIYLYLDEPADRVLARVEEVHRDPRDILASTYTVRLLTGTHIGEIHDVPEMALSPLGQPGA